MTVSLSVRDVTAVYDAPGGGTLPALDPLNFTIRPGEFVCLVGPSGCGKSTLIRILAGLQHPTTGVVLLDEQPILEPSAQVGLMFQDSNLMPWRTVLDNIALPLELAGVTQAERYQTVRNLLPTLGLTEFALAFPAELSGGMAQRVALGRVLVQHPGVLLLDEPFGALDALTREQISLELMQLRSGQTVVMVTHNIQEAVLLADRILVFSRRPGRIIADIPVPLARPRDLEVSYTEAFGDIARRVRSAINDD
ncbi:MAG: ABC transporter ATP-binding protein [Chloroflexota bacterium]